MEALKKKALAPVVVVVDNKDTVVEPTLKAKKNKKKCMPLPRGTIPEFHSCTMVIRSLHAGPGYKPVPHSALSTHFY
jgi:hypothetical protein